jgi:hypothetical protein
LFQLGFAAAGKWFRRASLRAVALLEIHAIQQADPVAPFLSAAHVIIELASYGISLS